jgi:hypothetical protein
MQLGWTRVLTSLYSTPYTLFTDLIYFNVRALVTIMAQATGPQAQVTTTGVAGKQKSLIVGLGIIHDTRPDVKISV